MMASARELFRCKPIEVEARPGAAALRRSLGVFRLTLLGVGGTIGTGIFVAFSAAVPLAGPAVIVSFVIAGLTAGLTALCYAELASIMPESGSSYAYAYATLGELTAFIVGACLLLEYAVSGSAVAVGFGQYLNEILREIFGRGLPAALAEPPGRGGVFNAPAALLVFACAGVLALGARESASVNAVLVLLKLAVLALFAVLALAAFRIGHLKPFAPHGVAGIGAAASSIFFSYIGLDVVTTAGDEARRPQRTLPLAVIFSLLIVTSAYILVAVAAVGAQSWTRFAGQEAGLAVILQEVTGRTWPSLVLSFGALVSIFSVTLAIIYGQSRILFSMSRDGLLPPFLQRVSPRTGAPTLNTLAVAAFMALLAAVAPLEVLTDLTSLGTLVAFGVVSVGVIVLRRRRPDLRGAYRAPLYPVLPALSVAFCLYLIVGLSWRTHLLFAVWIGAACLIYFGYSRTRSRLGRSRADRLAGEAADAEAPAGPLTP